MFDTDGDGNLSQDEMKHLLHTLGERVPPEDFQRFYRETDRDGSGGIDYEEFVDWLAQVLQRDVCGGGGQQWSGRSVTETASPTSGEANSMDVEGATQQEQEQANEEDEEEEVEIPEDIRDLPPALQRARVLRRSLWLTGVGTVIVILFSDPMVDVLDAIGNRIGVPPFFVAFLLGPLASNASEMVASYKYAQKKTKKSISVSLSQLLGAACMNNTFCLFIFYLLIAARGFSWTYHAEVVAIILVQLVMTVIASKRVQTIAMAFCVISLLPLSLALVALLKATAFKGKES